MRSGTIFLSAFVLIAILGSCFYPLTINVSADNIASNDFEAGNTDGWLMETEGYGGLTTDSLNPHTGTYALKLYTNADLTNESSAYYNKSFVNQVGSAFCEFYLYTTNTSQPVTIGFYNHTADQYVYGNQLFQISTAINNTLVIQYETVSNGVNVYYLPYTLSSWCSLAFFYDASQPNEIMIYQDGILKTILTNMNNQGAQGLSFDTLRAKLTGPSNNIYLDDIRILTTNPYATPTVPEYNAKISYTLTGNTFNGFVTNLANYSTTDVVEWSFKYNGGNKIVSSTQIVVATSPYNIIHDLPFAGVYTITMRIGSGTFTSTNGGAYGTVSNFVEKSNEVITLTQNNNYTHHAEFTITQHGLNTSVILDSHNFNANIYYNLSWTSETVFADNYNLEGQSISNPFPAGYHIFTTDGNKQIVIRVYDTQPQYNTYGPVSIYIFNITVEAANAYTVTGTGLAPTFTIIHPEDYPDDAKALWVFGDNASKSTNLSTPYTHTYAMPGNYTVILTITNANNVILGNNVVKFVTVAANTNVSSNDAPDEVYHQPTLPNAFNIDIPDAVKLIVIGIGVTLASLAMAVTRLSKRPFIFIIGLVIIALAYFL